jgi:hypothetical protein
MTAPIERCLCGLRDAADCECTETTWPALLLRLVDPLDLTDAREAYALLRAPEMELLLPPWADGPIFVAPCFSAGTILAMREELEALDGSLIGAWLQDSTEAMLLAERAADEWRAARRRRTAGVRDAETVPVAFEAAS